MHAAGLRLAERFGNDRTQAELLVLAELHAAEGECALADLQARFGHRPTTLSNVLGRLERDGLATRRRDPDDGRAIRVELTAAGRALARDAFTELAAIDRIVRASGIDPQAFAQAVDALARS